MLTVIAKSCAVSAGGNLNQHTIGFLNYRQHENNDETKSQTTHN
jgi:hypothetical protein